MRHWINVILLTMLAGCTLPQKAPSVANSEATFHNSESGIFVSESVSSDTIGFVAGHLPQKAPSAANSKAAFHNSESGVFVSESVSGDTIGFVAGHFTHKDKVDTLYCIAIGTSHFSNEVETFVGNCMNTYKLTNDIAGIPTLYLTDFYFLNNVKTHDLVCFSLPDGDRITLPITLLKSEEEQ